MRAMVGEDIPLNAGCLVPLDSESRDLHSLNRSIYSRGLLFEPRTHGCCVRRQRSYQSENHRYRPQSIWGLRGESGLLQQVRNESGPVLTSSLSFGAGGKDPVTGEVRKGWGYYEVGTLARLH